MASDTRKPMPPPVSVRKLLGPSFIILALGLGSGEVILWPYLAANHGLGIAWGVVLGISFQYLVNMEIERYALVKGESVFVGLAQQWRWTPYWFIVSTFIGFGLPGIVASSAYVFGALLGVEYYTWIAIGFLLCMGLFLSIGKTVYGSMEKITKIILLLGVPFIFFLAMTISRPTDWASLLVGLVGVGDDYRFFPSDLVFATFLAAFAYSGAGGNLNLTQSIYVKEKGYGMGQYAEKIAGLFRAGGAEQRVRLHGVTALETRGDVERFQHWWHRMSLEHGMVFWGIGLLSILLLMVLAHAATGNTQENAQGIQFVVNEAWTIGLVYAPWLASAFLLVVSVLLFQTQLGVLDSTSRIMAENAALAYTRKSGNERVPLSRLYYGFLWTQILFSIVLILCGVSEPKQLLVIGACLNAFAMFVHIGLVTWLNARALPAVYQPALWRRVALVGIFLFFGFFSGFVIIQQFT